MLRVVTIVGARPQFVKASVLSKQLKITGIQEYLIHTGQHFDSNMSEVFFQELGVPRPVRHLDVHSDSNTAQTARVMIALEQPLKEIAPDAVIIYGDTNATLAGALVSAQLQIPVFHVEAGLRSYDRRMPEEMNRVLADSIASLLFCPTETAVGNLAREGMTKGVFNVGDIMYDAILQYSELARERSTILELLKIHDKQYVLATVHRNFNTDNVERLDAILHALAQSQETIVLPLHPRTRKMIGVFGIEHYLEAPNIVATEPLGYLDMIRLQAGAKVIVTDSGGIQKEAYFNGVPSVILRENTEWVELIEMGWGALVPIEADAIIAAIDNASEGTANQYPYGSGNTGKQISMHIHRYIEHYGR